MVNDIETRKWREGAGELKTGGKGQGVGTPGGHLGTSDGMYPLLTGPLQI